MNEEIKIFLEKVGWDTKKMESKFFNEEPWYTDFHFVDDNHTIVCFTVLGVYLQEVRSDGTMRNCGLSQGCFWTEWE